MGRLSCPEWLANVSCTSMFHQKPPWRHLVRVERADVLNGMSGCVLRSHWGSLCLVSPLMIQGSLCLLMTLICRASFRYSSLFIMRAAPIITVILSQPPRFTSPFVCSDAS